jgi:hypothetical protein
MCFLKLFPLSPKGHLRCLILKLDQSGNFEPAAPVLSRVRGHSLVKGKCLNIVKGEGRSLSRERAEVLSRERNAMPMPAQERGRSSVKGRRVVKG